jgi:hypothetical protein
MLETGQEWYRQAMRPEQLPGSKHHHIPGAEETRSSQHSSECRTQKEWRAVGGQKEGPPEDCTDWQEKQRVHSTWGEEGGRKHNPGSNKRVHLASTPELGRRAE